MRKRFEQQITLGRVLIEEVNIPTKKRLGPLPALFAALKEIYVTPKWNNRVFEVLERQICPNKTKMGRPGMDLWVIFVLAQVRNCKNISYDELHYMANNDKLLRQMLGVENAFFDKHNDMVSFSYQTIIDNLSLLTDEALKEINRVIVEMGHEVFKKKRNGSIVLKNR